EAIRVLQTITTRDPNDEDAKLTLALAHTHLGNTLLQLGDPAASLKEGERADEIVQALPEAARRATEALAAQRDNYHGLAEAARALTARGVKTDACIYYRRGLRVAEALEHSVGIGPGEYSPQVFRDGLSHCGASAATIARSKR
ncbi:MAG TPA: hypothetical protein VJ743_19970, partial [Albitalea sp.]|nr:hypothetical protein [Albitalea sp.]